ncbi:MAG: lytic transglycosylase domain-containing protein [Candidatus Micrarchaeia archaeon]
MIMRKMEEAAPFGSPMQEAALQQPQSREEKVRQAATAVIAAYENVMSDRLNMRNYNELQRALNDIRFLKPDEQKEALGMVERLDGIKIDPTGTKFINDVYDKTRLETVMADYFSKEAMQKKYARTIKANGIPLYNEITNKARRVRDLASGGWLQSEKELEYISNSKNDADFERRLGIVKSYENERIQGFPKLPRDVSAAVTFPSYIQYTEYIASKYTPEEARALAYGFTDANSVVGKTLAQRLSAYEPIVNRMSAKYGVDKNLIYAVIAQESGGNPLAESWCGAKGMMQLMDPTAKDMGVENSFDPAQNIEGGTKYLAGLLKQYGNEKLALVAYNAGPKRADKYIATGWLPQETSDYVPRVMSFYEQFKDGKLAVLKDAKDQDNLRGG